MWNLSLSEKLIFFTEKCRQCRPFIILWNFNIFFKIHQISSNLQNILKSSSETCMWNLSLFREVKFFHRKMPTVPALYNIMKFQHFFKVHQISSNLQNILESSSETCMWNLSLFREVKFFHRKMLTVPALEISWNFNIFQSSPNYIKLAEHIESSSETCMWIWAHSEKLNFFTVPALKMQHFFQNSPNFIKLDSAMWNLSPFKFFQYAWNFNIFSKFTKFHQTCRTYWNRHQKHACEIWAYSEKLNFFTEKCWQCRP